MRLILSDRTEIENRPLARYVGEYVLYGKPGGKSIYKLDKFNRGLAMKHGFHGYESRVNAFCAFTMGYWQAENLAEALDND